MWARIRNSCASFVIGHERFIQINYDITD